MNNKKVNGQTHSFGMPVLLLILIMTFASASLIISGSGIHNKITDNTEKHYTLYTGGRYITEKCRQAGNIQSATENDVLCLKLHMDDVITYIYSYDGYLRELSMYSDSDFVPSAGEKLTRIDRITVDEKDSIFTIGLYDASGNNTKLMISCPGDNNE